MISKGGEDVKTLAKSLIIAVIFFVGTLSVIHVDRQTALMNRETPQIMKTMENTIEKYTSLR